jgi:hypothetical protein
MDEILKKLLQTDLLNEETKQQISEQWTKAVETFKQQVREETTLEVRSELAEQWIQERDDLVSKVDALVAQTLENELSELHEEIERARTQEVRYAEQLIEQKREMAEQVDEELDRLVDNIDSFFTQRLEEEFAELNEDLAFARQNAVGMKIYEAFASTFAQVNRNDDSASSKALRLEARVAELEEALTESEQQRLQAARTVQMEKLLGNLAGQKREQMEMLLRGVETSRLEESYKYFIGKVLKEDKQQATQAATTLSEGLSTRKTTLVTGNTQLAESVQGDDFAENLKRLAGLKK